MMPRSSGTTELTLTNNFLIRACTFGSFMLPPSTVISSKSARKKNLRKRKVTFRTDFLSYLGNCFLLPSRAFCSSPRNAASSVRRLTRLSNLPSTKQESFTVGFFVVSVIILTYALKYAFKMDKKEKKFLRHSKPWNQKVGRFWGKASRKKK